MRVLHIAECSLSGGMGSYFEEISSYQLARFGENAVAFVIPEGQSHFLPAVPRTQIFEFSWRGRGMSELAFFAWASLSTIGHFQPDLIHLHATFAGALLRPALVLRRRRPKIVYSPHGWPFARDVSTIHKRFYGAVECALAPLADCIVNISNAGRLDALSAGIPDALMTTIRNGIAARPAGLSEPTPCARLGAIRLLFLGRYDRQKGLDFLLRAFSQIDLPHLHLDIVGSAVVDKSSRGVTSFTAPNVTFHGWMPHENALEMIGKADAVVMPSRWEGFGLVAVEAMRAGKPIIASRRGALPEIVDDTVTGLLFDFGNAFELQNILQQLDKSRLAEMGKAARRRFESEFTSERMNRDLESLYRSVMQGSEERDRPH